MCGQCKALGMYRDTHKNDTPGWRLAAWATSIGDALKSKKRML